MSFSGKRFKRVRCENMDALLAASDINDNIKHMLMGASPTFSFTRVDDNTFNFKLEMENKVMAHDFKLGEEHEAQRRDGSKVMITYTLESDNVLKQVIKPPDGRLSYFRREFGDREAKMARLSHIEASYEKTGRFHVLKLFSGNEELIKGTVRIKPGHMVIITYNELPTAIQYHLIARHRCTSDGLLRIG